MADQTELVDKQWLHSRNIHYTRRHLLRLEDEGRFPPRIYLSARRICWNRAAIEQWIRDREAESKLTHSQRAAAKVKAAQQSATQGDTVAG